MRSPCVDLCAVLLRRERTLSRGEGALLLTLYAGYTAGVVLRG